MISGNAEGVDEDRRKYEFKKAIKSLREYEGSGTQFVTICIPEDKQISDVAGHIITKHSETSSIKSKQTRTDVQDALTSTRDRLRYYGNFPPDNGTVMSSGAADAGDNQMTMVIRVLESPLEPTQSFRYHCDSNFLAGPLEGMLMDKGLLGPIVLDRREADISWFKGKHVESVKSTPSLVPGKQQKGGQSAQRLVHLRLEAADNFYQKVVGMVNDLFIPKCHDMDGTPVGDPSPTKDEFLDGDYLHHELQDPVVGEFDVAYTDESGPYNFIDVGQDALVDQEAIKDKKQTEGFFEKLHRGNGSIYGFEATHKNLVVRLVGRLLISEDLRKDITVCDYGGQEEYELVDHRHNTPTRECDDGSEAELKDREDIIEWLMDPTDQRGTETKFISTDSGKGEQLYDVSGGIVGILRYSTDT